MRESDLQIWVAKYLRLQYPAVMFHSDFGAGVKLTKAQAIRQARQNGGLRGWPDLFIAERRMRDGIVYGGLFIELKRQGTRLRKLNGEWASPHIAEQADMLERLRRRGYRADFAVGRREAKRLIDNYLAPRLTRRGEE